MARRKKSGSSSGAIGALILGVLVLIASIPREVWIGAGICLAIGAAIYVYIKANKMDDERESIAAPTAPVSPPRPVVTPRKGAPPIVIAPPASPLIAAGTEPARAPEPSAPRAAVATPAVSTPTPKAPTPASRFVDTLEPVSVAQPAAQVVAPAPSFRIPAAPADFKTTRWIPKGEAVTIAGVVTISGGMLYVGPTLPTPSGSEDPSLINPKLQVAGRGDYTQRELGYWPGYSTISATARRAYLNWLADGRKDPAADVGFVFLFFYGLERRAIIDASKSEAVRADWPGIEEEVRRLLGIYGGKSESFRRYAGALLDCLAFAEIPSKLYLKPVPELRPSYELPMYLRVALGQASADGAFIPASLAQAWVCHDPSTFLRTPATRCQEQFGALFQRKYAEAFGEGMQLSPNRTKLKMVYRPASAGLQGGGDVVLTFGDIPDVSALTAPIKKLHQLVVAATDELDSYSRYVGKNPNGANALEGLLLLPPALWPDSAQKALQGLAARMGEGMVTMSFQNLLDSLEAKTVLTKDKTLALARALEAMNIGIEPDVLGGAKLPKPEEKVVLFSVPPGELSNRTTPAYQAAALTLQLASAVAAADGDFGVEEMGHLRAQVQSWTHLTPSHIRRLLAQLRLLMLAPVSLTSLKKRLEPLDVAAKEAIASFMASVAQADGVVTPAEVKMLEKVYKALGVEPKKVFSDVYAASVGVALPASVKAGESGFKLDPARIAALQQDTEAVSAMLARIFTEEPHSTPTLVEAEPELEAERPPDGLLGLDEAHSAFARLLLSRPEWSKDDLADVAADLDLMVDGALEQLNEAAFDAHDVPFVEGEDPVTVNPELLEKLEA